MPKECLRGTSILSSIAILLVSSFLSFALVETYFGFYFLFNRSESSLFSLLKRKSFLIILSQLIAKEKIKSLIEKGKGLRKIFLFFR